MTDLQTAINATPSGGTLNVTGQTFSGNFTISQPMTLIGGTINVASGVGITVSANNVSILNPTITGPASAPFNGANMGIFAAGSSSVRLSGLVIQGATISKFQNAGIWTSYTSGEIISGNTVTDCQYAGIMVLSDASGTIGSNDVERIGMSPSGQDANNAYNIAVSDGGSNPSTDTVVENNIVVDNPYWQGLDTHSGVGTQFLHNTVSRCSRALFISAATGRPTNVVVTGNQLLSPAPVTYNLTPLTLYNVNGITITGNNFVGWGGESPTPSVPYYDFGDLSTGIVVGSGNVVTP